MSLLVVVAVAAAVATTPPVASAFQPIAYFGSFGDDAGELWNPGGLAIDGNDLFYVADYTNNRIDVFSPTGKFVRAFGKDVDPVGGDVCSTETKCQAGEFSGSAGGIIHPEDVAVGPSGDIFVADRENNRIDVFSAAGVFLRAFGKEVAPGGGNVCTSVCQAGEEAAATAGSVSQPLGIGISPAGTVFVAGYRNNRVDVFSPEGDFIRAFGKEVNPAGGDVCTLECQAGEESGDSGAFTVPRDVAVGLGGEVVVTDLVNNRVDVFSPEGDFIRAFGKEVNPAGGDVCTLECQAGEAVGSAGALYGPTPIVADGAGGFYIGDVWNARIAEFAPDGTFVRAFGGGVIDGGPDLQVCTLVTGCRAGFMNTSIVSVPFPYGIAVDCRGTVYAVVEIYGADYARVVRYGEFGTPPPPCEPEPEGEGEPEGGGESGPQPGGGSQPGGGPASPSAPTTRPSPPPRQEKREPIVVLDSLYLVVGTTHDLKRGTATLEVEIEVPAKLVVEGRGIRKAVHQAKGKGIFKLPIEPVGHVANLLDRRGKATIKARLVFKPHAPYEALHEFEVKLRKRLPAKRKGSG